MKGSVDYRLLATSELLRVVDRSNPEVKALAARIETILELNRDAMTRMDSVVKDAINELCTG